MNEDNENGVQEKTWTKGKHRIVWRVKSVAGGKSGKMNEKYKNNQWVWWMKYLKVKYHSVLLCSNTYILLL